MLLLQVAVGTQRRLPTASRNETYDVMDFACLCHGRYKCPQFDSCIAAELTGTGFIMQDEIHGIDYRWVEGLFTLEITGLSLDVNSTYYVTVRATDASYSSITSQSDPVRIDVTPPHAGSVRVGRHGAWNQPQYYLPADEVFVEWWGFGDVESGLSSYEVALTEDDSCARILP